MARKRKKIIIAVAAVVIAYVAYTHLMPSGPPGGPPPGGAAPVSVAEVMVKDVAQWNEFSGRLVAVDQADIRPQVSGVLQKVHFEDGAYVTKGDVLFTIDPRPFVADITRAEGALASAQAQNTLAQNDLQRATNLLKDKAIPQHDYDQRRNDAGVAQANLKSAQAALEIAKLNLDYAQVKAPISGRVSRAEVTAGNLVQAGNPILTTIVTATPIYADFEISEDIFLQYAHAGLNSNKESTQIPVLLGLAGEAEPSHEGHIESFDNRLNNASGTVRVRAVFDNADGMFVPGLFARIKLGAPNNGKTILITDRAVGTDQNKKFVLVVGDDNKVAYREVKLGASVDGLRVVRDGLKPGEKIIVNGLQRARPGSSVTPQLVPMDSKDTPATGSEKPAAS